MFNTRSIIVTLLALICGGLAMMGVQGVMGPRSGGGATTSTVQILVPKVTIPRGSLLDETTVEFMEWPEVPAVKYMIKEMKALSGRRSLETLYAGEPLLDSKLGLRGQIPSAAMMVGEGMRAICIQFPTPAAAMAGLIFPKDRVDLYLTERADSANAEPSSKLLLGNVEVFAIGDQLESRRDKEKEKSKDLQMTSVTFHVLEKDTEILEAARLEGQLSIGLRNPNEKQVADLPVPSISSEVAVQPASDIKPVVPRKAKSVPVPQPIMIFRGNSVGLVDSPRASGR